MVVITDRRMAVSDIVLCSGVHPEARKTLESEMLYFVTKKGADSTWLRPRRQRIKGSVCKPPMKAGEVERLSQQLHMLSVEYILAVLHRVTEESDSIHINLPGPISPRITFEMRISNVILGEIGLKRSIAKARSLTLSWKWKSKSQQQASKKTDAAINPPLTPLFILFTYRNCPSRWLDTSTKQTKEGRYSIAAAWADELEMEAE